MDLKGRFAQGTLPGLLRTLYVGRKSGELRLASADAERSVRFHAGEVLYARSNLPAEQFGATLVRANRLSQADLDRAEELARLDGLRLDQALQKLGALDREALEKSLAVYVRDVLLASFASDGEYEFHEQAGPGNDGDVSPRVSTGELILDAVRQLRDPDVVRHGLGDLDRRLGLTSDPRLRFQKLTLTPTDGYVLSRVDGTLNAREIATLTPLPPEDVLRSLLGLLATGLVEHTAPPAKPAPRTGPLVVAAARPEAAASATGAPHEAAERRREIVELHAALQTRTHFEVLDLARDASEADVKAAYFRLARRFHPDVHQDPALADLRNKLEAIFIRLGEAYDVLKNAQARRAYEARLPRASSTSGTPAPGAPAHVTLPPTPPPADPAANVDRALRQAERHLSSQQYWDAIQVLEPALPQAQGRALARVRLLLAKALLKNPHWVRRAEETLLAIIKDDPQHVQAHFLLGEIYKNGGLRARAASMFRKVLELQPEHEEAAVQLAEVAPVVEPEPAPPEKPGLLKKFFGRQ